MNGWRHRLAVVLRCRRRVLRWARSPRRFERRIVGGVDEDAADRLALDDRRAAAAGGGIGVTPAVPRPFNRCHAIDLAEAAIQPADDGAELERAHQVFVFDQELDEARDGEVNVL